jgi:hypothetical protein
MDYRGVRRFLYHCNAYHVPVNPGRGRVVRAEGGIARGVAAHRRTGVATRRASRQRHGRERDRAGRDDAARIRGYPAASENVAALAERGRRRARRFRCVDPREPRAVGHSSGEITSRNAESAIKVGGSLFYMTNETARIR